MTFAVAGILGHNAKTLLLFFVPQVPLPLPLALPLTLPLPLPLPLTLPLPPYPYPPTPTPTPHQVRRCLMDPSCGRRAMG